MDVTIDEALQTAAAFLQAEQAQQVLPSFIINPL